MLGIRIPRQRVRVNKVGATVIAIASRVTPPVHFLYIDAARACTHGGDISADRPTGGRPERHDLNSTSLQCIGVDPRISVQRSDHACPQ